MSDEPPPPGTGPDLAAIRAAMRQATYGDEAAAVARLMDSAPPAGTRAAISSAAAALIREVRSGSDPGLMERFLAEYGLSTKEGIALMCLAEALLRVPDHLTINALIQDKIAPADWGRHLGRAASSLVNASTWALMLTGRVLTDGDEAGLARTLRGMVRRLGEPVVRTAVGQAMRQMGAQFVLGRSIEEATERAARMEAKGYTYSYDMLGEAARTEDDAQRYHIAYSDAIAALAARAKSRDIRANPGISVKLSALHPRYEQSHREEVLSTLASRAQSLALLAKSARMGFNIDAEEADRLDLSLDVIEKLLADPALAGWDGFGVVVQAYGKRAPHVLDWLYRLAETHDRRIMVRLVKGAYWDSEIKRAQVMGLDGFPVFTRKVATDVSYLACARQLLGMTDRIYPQFATHNAHTVAAVRALAGDGRDDYEFQRLHGMGEALYETVRRQGGLRCRVYAPVGAHRDLLAYLVRRLLENGANSSFVHQIVDESVAPETIATDPFDALARLGNAVANPAILAPEAIFGPDRKAARGWDITDPLTLAELETARAPFRSHRWSFSVQSPGELPAGETVTVRNPARPDEVVGTVETATPAHVDAALETARAAASAWAARPVGERAALVERVADLYEAHAPELMAIAAREAGKTLADGVAEVREAVDFCRYYAREARRLDREEPGEPGGVFVCISPWNFPLAIFTGQIAAALVTGNAVVAKPAEQTMLMAGRAVALMHEAGIPPDVLHCLPGDGATVGAALTSDSRIDGVCFTGSVETAQAINRAMADNVAPDAALIAETGGLNAMIVDSTALPEQAVRDILASAFQSAGQRCSALRILYVQKDVEARMTEMLTGAMDALTLGDPWELTTDVGPLIDAEAHREIEGYCQRQIGEGRLVHRVRRPKGDGCFLPPTVLKSGGIADLEREVFGPVLHLATYEAAALNQVVADINAKGYGLTMGLHTRVDQRVQDVVDRARIGNVYVNRNQIGAVVGSQPFGGEGLSGTGPKAGGPHYLPRFRRIAQPVVPTSDGTTGAVAVLRGASIDEAAARLDWQGWARHGDREGVLAGAIAALEPHHPDRAALAREALAEAVDIGLDPAELPGPTGESNRLSLHPRGVFVCAGSLVAGERAACLLAQTVQALMLGNGVVAVGPGADILVSTLARAGAPVSGLDSLPDPGTIAGADGFAGLALTGPAETLCAYRMALAGRDGALLPLVTAVVDPRRYMVERALCIDTTAAGGNAALFSAADNPPATG
ncbi:MAG: bifunctional proline dehydrogenase/L-glutamate gamma-semialdehyde dehydrogenase PutA [Azospirillaceae bacterium]